MAALLLPEDLQVMKLGVHKSWTPSVPVPRAGPGRPGIMCPPPLAWGRIGVIPRCQGHNDREGDCVPTGCINFVLDYKGCTEGNFDPISDDLADQIYRDVTGYDGTPSTDQGTDPDAMFAWWKQNPIAGWTLKEAVPFNPQDRIDVEEVISGTSAMVGVVDLRVAQQNQRTWRTGGDETEWGLHFLCFDQYVGALAGTSWGYEQWADWEFFASGRVLQCWELEITK